MSRAKLFRKIFRNHRTLVGGVQTHFSDQPKSQADQYASMKVCKYASFQVCKYAGMQ